MESNLSSPKQLSNSSSSSMQNIAENPTYHLLREAQAEPLNLWQYNSEGTRATIVKKFTKVFEGK
jgi:hypothetical protein